MRNQLVPLVRIYEETLESLRMGGRGKRRPSTGPRETVFHAKNMSNSGLADVPYFEHDLAVAAPIA